MDYKIVRIRDYPVLLKKAAAWFNDKWHIPQETYYQSMKDCLENNDIVPQWYVVLKDDVIIAGAGVIENDFHKRKDLSPNLCALYVEKAYRRQNIAKSLLDYICKDMYKKGISILYLITDHTDFYDHCGWQYIGMVEEESGSFCRMYQHG